MRITILDIRKRYKEVTNKDSTIQNFIEDGYEIYYSVYFNGGAIIETTSIYYGDFDITEIKNYLESLFDGTKEKGL